MYELKRLSIAIATYMYKERDVTMSYVYFIANSIIADYIAMATFPNCLALIGTLEPEGRMGLS